MSALAENFIAALVAQGLLEVRHDGSIWRRMKRTRVGRLVPCEVRADHKAAKGYRAVIATVEGARYQAMAHRVVWIVHNGPVPAGQEINHKDGVRDNNRPSNLEPLSHGANQKHAYDCLGRARCYGTRNGSAKLASAQVAQIRGAQGESSSRAVAQQFGVSHRQILNIWSGKKWATPDNGFPA